MAAAKFEAAEDLLAYWKSELESLQPLKISLITDGDGDSADKVEKLIAIANKTVAALEKDLPKLR